MLEVGDKGEASSRGNKPKSKIKKYLCGLAAKRETTYWNMAVIPLVPFIAATISFYSTTFLPLLLQHVDYFHIP